MTLHIDPPLTRPERVGPCLMAVATILAVLLIDAVIEASVRRDQAHWNEVHHVRR